MNYRTPGKFRTIDQFREQWRGLDSTMDCDTSLAGQGGPLDQPLMVSSADGRLRAIGNRFCVHPMEGWDGTPEGGPSPNTIRRWQRFGESGAKLIWGGEAFAVQPDGRANPNQLHFNPDPKIDNHANLSTLLDALTTTHTAHFGTTDDLLVGLQLTHSGRFCRPVGKSLSPRIAEHNPLLAEKFGHGNETHVLSDTELREISSNIVRSAVLAYEVGFHFVDVKCCHGYLLHELLGARTRSGDFGGSFDNRTRLFRETVQAIRVAAPGLMIGCRVSITDLPPFFKSSTDRRGFPKDIERHLPWQHSFGVNPTNPLASDWTEPIEFLKLCQSLGVFMVNLTVGSPYYCPHFQRPAAHPPSDGYLPPHDPMMDVIRQLKGVRALKQHIPDLPMVGTGWSYLQEWLPYVAQYEIRHGHVDSIGLGRSMLSYPTLPADAIAGRKLNAKKICRTFSDCTTGPRNGMVSGCYPLDDHYKDLPEASMVRELRKQATSP